MGIAANIRRLRAREKLSQAGLAKLSGVSQQLISQLEDPANDGSVRTTKLPEIARALKAKVQEIDPNYTDDVTGSAAPDNWMSALAEAIALAVQAGIGVDQIALTISTLMKLASDNKTPAQQAEAIREAARAAQQLHDHIRTLDNADT